MENLGPTGKYPQGKLNAKDDGEIRLAVYIEEKVVIVNFGVPTLWIGLGPKEARALAVSLVTKADDIERGK